MDVMSFVGGVVGGIVGSSAVFPLVVSLLKDRWLAAVKAEYNKELELVKNSLQSGQKKLQAQIDHGSFVTQAQYDLELSIYKEMWDKLAALRTASVDLYAPAKFHLKGPDGPVVGWQYKLLLKNGEAFGEAHNNALTVLYRSGPFVPENIYTSALDCTRLSYPILAVLTDASGDVLAESWYQSLRQVQEPLVTNIDEVRELIRTRLAAMRIL